MCASRNDTSGSIWTCSVTRYSVIFPLSHFTFWSCTQAPLTFRSVLLARLMPVAMASSNDLFDEAMICGEDVDFSWRMQERSAWRLAFHPEALVYHKFRSDVPSFWVQARKWGYGAVFVMVRHGVPMRREELPRRLAEYKGIVKQGVLLPWLWLQARRGAIPLAEWEQRQLDWLYRAGLKLGRLRASFEFRRLYL